MRQGFCDFKDRVLITFQNSGRKLLPPKRVKVDHQRKGYADTKGKGRQAVVGRTYLPLTRKN